MFQKEVMGMKVNGDLQDWGRGEVTKQSVPDKQSRRSAKRAKGCTCKEYFHTGLPCIHITWLVSYLGKDINDYIPRVFTVGVAKAIYTAKMSSFSDDLLKGIKLSPEFDGPLLPGKFMWKAEVKKDEEKVKVKKVNRPQVKKM